MVTHCTHRMEFLAQLHHGHATQEKGARLMDKRSCKVHHAHPEVMKRRILVLIFCKIAKRLLLGMNAIDVKFVGTWLPHLIIFFSLFKSCFNYYSRVPLISILFLHVRLRSYSIPNLLPMQLWTPLLETKLMLALTSFTKLILWIYIVILRTIIPVANPSLLNNSPIYHFIAWHQY